MTFLFFVILVSPCSATMCMKKLGKTKNEFGIVSDLIHWNITFSVITRNDLRNPDEECLSEIFPVISGMLIAH